MLDFVCAQRLFILQDATRVDEALTIGGDVLVIAAGELGLQVKHCSCLWHFHRVIAIAGGLDLEAELHLVAPRRLLGHGVVDRGVDQERVGL